jgi:uncharacterized protein YcgI (DUF1989 family)
MKLNVNDNHLALVDRVLEAGLLGKTREEVLNAAVVEHARYILSGGSVFDHGAAGEVEVDTPGYGPLREEIIIQPVTGKAVPVYAGEVLRVSQVEGGTCVDYNGYNLHDYKEYLDCGMNRNRGIAIGRGAVVWSNSPRARPMYAVADHSECFDQYYQGHRCNGIMYEIEYDFINHPNCQDTFAEAIREYGLTPDDTHDSYNLWMRTTVTPDGRRQFHWNRVQKDDYVDLLALIDTLSVPVICGGDVSALNNFDPRPIRLQVFAASPSTTELVQFVQNRWGRMHSQKTPRDFKPGVREIQANRELVRDDSYVPDYLPTAPWREMEINIRPEVDQLLETFLATGDYLRTREQALFQCFFRWYEATWKRDHINTKLAFRPR